VPFIFDPALAKRLLGMAAELEDYRGRRRRGPTYRTLFALFYGLGLRASEGCRLQCGDVDLDRCLLTIRTSKFGKTRLVPFGSKVGGLLREQLEYRRRQVPELAPSAPMFTFDGRRCVHAGGVSMTFLDLVRRMRLDVPKGMAAPHLHDLRHSFAVGTLLRWYRQGINAGEKLHYLSTFMGHADPASTVVYLTITDDLLKEANRRFESFAQPGGTP
jgi:integrase